MFDSEVKVFEEYIRELENANNRDKCSNDSECSKSRISRDDFPFGNSLVIKDAKITLNQDYFNDCGRRYMCNIYISIHIIYIYGITL